MFHFTCFNVEDPDDPAVGLVNGELAIPGNLLRREVFDPVISEVSLSGVHFTEQRSRIANTVGRECLSPCSGMFGKCGPDRPRRTQGACEVSGRRVKPETPSSGEVATGVRHGWVSKLLGLSTSLADPFPTLIPPLWAKRLFLEWRDLITKANEILNSHPCAYHSIGPPLLARLPLDHFMDAYDNLDISSLCDP